MAVDPIVGIDPIVALDRGVGVDQIVEVGVIAIQEQIVGQGHTGTVLIKCKTEPVQKITTVFIQGRKVGRKWKQNIQVLVLMQG